MRRMFTMLVLLHALCAGPACAEAPVDPMRPAQKIQVTGTHTRPVPYAELFYPMAKAVQRALLCERDRVLPQRQQR